MIVWGHWKDVYDTPIQLNFEVDTPEGLVPIVPLQQCIVEMICVQDCCHFITEDGSLYSMGSNMKGMLGLGRVTVTTSSHAMKVWFPSGKTGDEVKITDVKAGNNNMLALTTEGEVYAWGLNNHGQVGTPQVGGEKDLVIWDPILIYPIPEI